MKNEEKYDFKRQFVPMYNGHPFNNETGTSMCEPSMSLSVRDLMERHTRGLETNAIVRQEIELDEKDEVPKVIDMTDLSYRREKLEQTKKETEDEIRNQAAQKRAQKLETARIKKLAKEIEEDKSSTKPTIPVPPVPK